MYTFIVFTGGIWCSCKNVGRSPQETSAVFKVGGVPNRCCQEWNRISHILVMYICIYYYLVFGSHLFVTFERDLLIFPSHKQSAKLLNTSLLLLMFMYTKGPGTSWSDRCPVCSLVPLRGGVDLCLYR